MAVSFDPEKSERNERRRGLPFGMVADLDWTNAIFGVSRVQNFDTATRFFAIGPIGRAVYTTFFTFEGRGIRVVSLRMASKKERETWRRR